MTHMLPLAVRRLIQTHVVGRAAATRMFPKPAGDYPQFTIWGLVWARALAAWVVPSPKRMLTSAATDWRAGGPRLPPVKPRNVLLSDWVVNPRQAALMEPLCGPTAADAPATRRNERDPM